MGFDQGTRTALAAWLSLAAPAALAQLGGTGCDDLRGAPINFDFLPFLLSHGGRFVADAERGDYTVTINSPEALEALDRFLAVERACAPEGVAAMGQGDVIQLMAAGRAAMVETVTSAWATYADPSRSAVAEKIAAAPMPEGPAGRVVPFGNWHLAIPRGIPDARAEAALAFLGWFLTHDAQIAFAEAGGIPVRADVLDELAERPGYAWIAAYRIGLAAGVQALGFAEGPAIEQIMGLRLNQALTGELTPAAALNAAAREIEAVFRRAGRATGQLALLPE